MQCQFLHLFGDFSHVAIPGHLSGNSLEVSKGYFYIRTVSSNPLRSASKSLILQINFRRRQFARHFRRIAEPLPQEADRESELASAFTTILGIFSEGHFAGTVLVD